MTIMANAAVMRKSNDTDNARMRHLALLHNLHEPVIRTRRFLSHLYDINHLLALRYTLHVASTVIKFPKSSTHGIDCQMSDFRFQISRSPDLLNL